MCMKTNPFKKRLSMGWMIVIAVFVFFGGAVGGILFCGHYAHKPLAPHSGYAAAPAMQDQIGRDETTRFFEQIVLKADSEKR